jgi:integrase
VRESAKTANLDEAIKALNRILMTRDAKLLGAPDAFDLHRSAKKKLSTIFDYYIVARTPSNPRRVAKFLKNAERAFADFKEWRANQLTSEAIAHYIADQRALRKADGTILRTLRTVSAAIRLAHRASPPLLPTTIVVYIPSNLKANTRHGRYEPEEYAAHHRELPDYWKDMAEFLMWSGWRTGEAENLEWQDIRRGAGDNLRVTLPSERSKNDEARALQLTGKLRELIERRLAQRKPDCKYVFDYKGRQFLVSNHRDSWNSALKRAGLEHKVRHDFRRSTVTDLSELGVPNSVGQTVSGHKSDAVYQRYNCPRPADPAQVRALQEREAFVLGKIREQEERQKQQQQQRQITITPVGPSN